jgi:hypothetical protein
LNTANDLGLMLEISGEDLRETGLMPMRYLEPEKNKDIAQIIAPYNFEEFKNEKAAKKIEGESTGTIRKHNECKNS